MKITADNYQALNQDTVQKPRYVVAVDFGKKGTGTYQESYTNYLLYSEEFDNATGWTPLSSPVITANTDTAPNGGLTADKIEDNSTIAYGSVYQNFIEANGYDVTKSYTVSMFVKKDAVGRVTRFPTLQVSHFGSTSEANQLAFDTATGESEVKLAVSANVTGGVDDYDADYWRVWLTSTSNDPANDSFQVRLFAAFGASSTWVQSSTGQGSIIVWGAQLNEGGLRDYVQTVGSTANGTYYYSENWLYSRNLCLHSEAFANVVWIKSTVSVTLDTATAPDGTVTADTLEDTNSANVGHAVQFVQGSIFDVTQWHTGSVFIKKDTTAATTRFAGLRMRFTGVDSEDNDMAFDTSNGFFTIADGTTGEVNPGTFASVEDYDDDWWRVSITAKPVNQSNNQLLFYVQPARGAGSDLSVMDNTALGSVIAWGAQVEQGKTPTTYWKTDTVLVSGYTEQDDVAYFTSHTDALVPPSAPSAAVVSGCIAPRGISGQTQRISPDKAQHTIGNIKVKLLDVTSQVSALIERRSDLGAGMRQRTVKIYKGFEELQSFDDYSLICTYLIDQVSSKDGVYMLDCADIQRTSKTEIFTRHTGNLTSTIDAGDQEIPITVADAANKFPLVEHDLVWSSQPRALLPLVHDMTDVAWTKVNGVTASAGTVPGPFDGVTPYLLESDGTADPQIVQSYDTAVALGGRTFTMRVWLKVPAGETELEAQLVILDDSAGDSLVGPLLTLTEEWVQYELTHTFAGAEADTSIKARIDMAQAPTSGDQILFGGIQLYEPVSYGYIKIDDEVICHSGWTDGTYTKLGVIARGALNTQTAAHKVEATSSDQKKAVEEYIYLEMNAPRLIYSLLTGVIPGQAGNLPDHWNLQISTDFVRLSDFESVGRDLWDTRDDTGRIARFIGVEQVTGKQFIEKELLLWMGSFMPIYSDGRYGLRRLNPVLPDSAYSATIGEGDIVRYGDLVYDQKNVVNQMTVKWNWITDQERYTKITQLIDSTSIAKHKIAPQRTFEFKGVFTGAHTDQDIAQYFKLIRDRYANPPLNIKMTLMPEWDILEVGDVIRVAASQIYDTEESKTLDRTLEVQQATVDWVTGQVVVSLFGGIEKASDDVLSATTVLEDSFYTAEGTELSTVLTIVGGAVTANGTLNGAANHNEAIYYYDGDLTINSGVTVTWNQNIQLRVKGNLTVNGTLTGKGQGIAGGAGGANIRPQRVYGTFGIGVQLTWPDQGSGVFGKTFVQTTVHHWAVASFDEIRNNVYGPPITVGPDGVVDYHLPRYYAEGQFSEMPEPRLENIAGLSVRGTLADYRGVSGCGGQASVDFDSDGGYKTFEPIVAGANGAQGGGGLLFIGRGFFFGASGQVDSSGGDAVLAGSAANGGETYYGGQGSPGFPGGVQILIDGNASTPDPTKFVAKVGDQTVPTATLITDRKQKAYAPSGGTTWACSYHGSAQFGGDAGQQKDGMLRINYIPPSSTRYVWYPYDELLQITDSKFVTIDWERQGNTPFAPDFIGRDGEYVAFDFQDINAYTVTNYGTATSAIVAGGLEMKLNGPSDGVLAHKSKSAASGVPWASPRGFRTKFKFVANSTFGSSELGIGNSVGGHWMGFVWSSSGAGVIFSAYVENLTAPSQQYSEVMTPYFDETVDHDFDVQAIWFPGGLIEWSVTVDGSDVYLHKAETGITPNDIFASAYQMWNNWGLGSSAEILMRHWAFIQDY